MNISKRLLALVYIWSLLLSLKFQANTYSFERVVTFFVGYYFSSGHSVHTNPHTYIHILTSSHTYVQTYIHTSTHSLTLTQRRMHTYVQTYVPTCIYIHTCIRPRIRGCVIAYTHNCITLCTHKL